MNDKIRVALISMGEQLEDAKRLAQEAPTLMGRDAVTQLSNVIEFMLTTMQHLILYTIENVEADEG